MSSDLFRKQALDFAAERLHGHVVVLPKTSQVMLLLALGIGVLLSCLALIFSVHIERAYVFGNMKIHSGQVTAELYLPAKMTNAVKAQQIIQITPAMRRDSRIRPVNAEIASVGTETKLLKTDVGSSQPGAGYLYVPVKLTIDAESLRTAGLPTGDDAELAIDSTIILSRETWANWLIEKILRRATSI